MLEDLYHIHRNGNMDYIWHKGNEILVDDNFCALYYNRLLNSEIELINRYGENYNIDYIISVMEKMKSKNIIKDDMKNDFNTLLCEYYFLRREKALEQGRKLYNPTAPCRFNSIFLTDENDLYYWIDMVGKVNYIKFLLEVEGNLFMSSDAYFPDEKLIYEEQVEKSKKYWKPKVKSFVRNEFVFQGNVKIVKEYFN